MELNGQQARVVGWAADRNRYTIDLDGQQLAVRALNLNWCDLRAGDRVVVQQRLANVVDCIPVDGVLKVRIQYANGDKLEVFPDEVECTTTEMPAAEETGPVSPRAGPHPQQEAGSICVDL